MIGDRFFVDETKQRGHVLVAVTISSSDMSLVRRQIRELILPGQRRLHMKNESMSRKRSIASMISALPTRALVYDAGRRYPSERAAREACLHQPVTDAASFGATTLLIEKDDTLVASDRRFLYEATRRMRRRTAAVRPRDGDRRVPTGLAGCGGMVLG